MIRLPALLLVLGFGVVIAAEPTFADLPTEEFILVDGRKLVGRYDEAHGLLWLVGPANARLGLRPNDIARRRELAPGEAPSIPNAPLPSGAKGDGVTTVAPAIVLIAKKNDVAELEHRERDLTRLIGEQHSRRLAIELGIKQLNERYRDLREVLERNPDPNLGIESLRAFQVRETQGEILRFVRLLRQCEDRLDILNASDADAYLALTRGQAALGELERGDSTTLGAASTPAPMTPIDTTAWRIRELETKLDALQREHERLRRAYEQMRSRPAAPTPDRVQPSEEGQTPVRDDARLAQAPGG